jgi:hypothetical protein
MDILRASTANDSSVGLEVLMAPPGNAVGSGCAGVVSRSPPAIPIENRQKSAIAGMNWNLDVQTIGSSGGVG